MRCFGIVVIFQSHRRYDSENKCGFDFGTGDDAREEFSGEIDVGQQVCEGIQEGNR